MPLSAINREIYEYALNHLRAEREKIEEQILSVERELYPTRSSGPSIPAQTTTHTESAPTKKTGNAKPPKAKRVFSPEGKARMVEAQKTRWAAFHAAQKKTTDMLAKLEKKAKKAVKKPVRKAAKKKASDIPS
jgi:hypothetical protein